MSVVLAWAEDVLIELAPFLGAEARQVACDGVATQGVLLRLELEGRVGRESCPCAAEALQLGQRAAWLLEAVAPAGLHDGLAAEGTAVGGPDEALEAVDLC